MTQTTEPRGSSIFHDVAGQLRDLERQGGGMAGLAHVCAGLLLIAFSAGSLISLSLAAFVKFMAELNAGRADVPDAINIAVNVLMVLAMDVAMLYAASVLRVLLSTDAASDEGKWHRRAMVWAAFVESSTYAYMLWQFDRPDNFWLWVIGLMRAFSAPLFATYLAMARALPVAPRDIMYHSALASGKGVVTDVATLSADPTAPLDRKVRIFRAASTMTTNDRAKLDTLVSELREDRQQEAPVRTQADDGGAGDDDRPPTGPGTPIRKPPVRTPRQSRQEAGRVVQLGEPTEWPGRRAARAKKSPVRTPRPARVASYEKEAREAFANGATSVARMERATTMGHAAASSWVRMLKAEAKATAQTRQEMAQ